MLDLKVGIMPLSKARDKERARERRKLAKRASNLTRQGVQPKTDAPQSKSSGLKEEPRHIGPSHSNLIFTQDMVSFLI